MIWHMQWFVYFVPEFSSVNIPCCTFSLLPNLWSKIQLGEEHLNLNLFFYSWSRICDGKKSVKSSTRLAYDVEHANVVISLTFLSDFWQQSWRNCIWLWCSSILNGLGKEQMPLSLSFSFCVSSGVNPTRLSYRWRIVIQRESDFGLWPNLDM